MTRHTCPWCGAKKYRAYSAPWENRRMFVCMVCEGQFKIPNDESWDRIRERADRVLRKERK